MSKHLKLSTKILSVSIGLMLCFSLVLVWVYPMFKKGLQRAWKYDSFFYGEAVTTGPSSGIMSLPRGVRTRSLQRALILLSGAPTCVWHRFTNSGLDLLFVYPIDPNFRYLKKYRQLV